MEVQWLTLWASNAGGMGSILDQETKAPRARWHDKKKNFFFQWKRKGNSYWRKGKVSRSWYKQRVHWRKQSLKYSVFSLAELFPGREKIFLPPAGGRKVRSLWDSQWHMRKSSLFWLPNFILVRFFPLLILTGKNNISNAYVPTLPL